MFCQACKENKAEYVVEEWLMAHRNFLKCFCERCLNLKMSQYIHDLAMGCQLRIRNVEREDVKNGSD